jgi:hypothetical protein
LYDTFPLQDGLKQDALLLGSPTFLGQSATAVTIGSSQTTHGKMTVSGIPNCLNYCEIFIVYAFQFQFQFFIQRNQPYM